MDHDDLLHISKIKQECVDETPETLSDFDINVKEEIEFCAVQEIKQELVEFDHNLQTCSSDSTVVAHTSSLFEYSGATYSQSCKQEIRDDEDVSNDNTRATRLESCEQKQKYEHSESQKPTVVAAKSDKDFKIYSCDICKKGFVCRRNISKHMSYAHSNKKHKCEICHKYLSHKYSLIAHLKRHKGIKNYKCKICAKYFIDSNTLRKHLMTHQGKRFECDLCKNKFTQKYNLRMHMVKHIGYSSHQCHMCMKYFTEPRDLNMHLKSHLNIREFTCHICQRSFVQKGHLTDHLKIHAGVRYTCTVCEKTFAQKTSLTRHMKMHHND